MFVLAFAGLLSAHTADAALGGSVDSVARDRDMLQGSDIVTPTVNYDLHEIRAASGTTVREYISRQGTVFAVAWEGPSNPNLQQLLGESYASYQTLGHAHRGSHHLLTIDTPNLVASVLRLQRSSIGHVHVPPLLPAGVTVADLR
jgi:hypothetical protein